MPLITDQYHDGNKNIQIPVAQAEDSALSDTYVKLQAVGNSLKVHLADGQNITLGAKTDARVAHDANLSQSFSAIAILKAILYTNRLVPILKVKMDNTVTSGTAVVLPINSDERKCYRLIISVKSTSSNPLKFGPSGAGEQIMPIAIGATYDLGRVDANTVYVIGDGGDADYDLIYWTAV